MQIRQFLLPPFVFASSLAVALSAQAAGRVQLELVGDTRGSALVFQQWLQTLGQAGVKNMRIRAAGPSDNVGIEVRGTAESPIYVVTGVVRSANELVLPSGRYAPRDARRLARWLEDLARLGPEDRREPKSAFGLTAAQFEQLHEDLSLPVGFSTRDMNRAEAVEKIGHRLPKPLKLAAGLATSLQGKKIAEELQTVSCGTALAYVLRPVGQCVVPDADGPAVGLAVVAAKPALEVWPVGWEPERPLPEVLPAAFEMHNVNVQGVSAAVTLEAMGQRLKVPVLIDHNALARYDIQPEKVIVSHPQRRTTYNIALRKLLSQAGLKSEIRVDEAGKPFLWVSSIKPM
ncbi:MAG: hypothetical protein JXB62_13565 [Pirellulales bacterium]|nr:hypothetical protein [Pirellulales bacterium]